MPSVDVNRFALHVVCGAAHGPAPFEFFHFPPKRLRDDLVAEADPNEGAPVGIDCADEGLEWWYPRMVFIGAMLGASDQPTVRIGRGVRIVLIHDVPCSEGEAMVCEKPREHSVIIAQLFMNDVGDMAGLQNADLHGELII